MRCIAPKYTVRVCCISKVPSVGCDGWEMTNGSVIPRGGEAMEASRNFSCNTCLSEFDQGWVRDHQSLGGSKKYQRKDTNKIISWLISITNIYIWIPHPRDPEAGILHIVRNCCWFLETNIKFLGDLSFVLGEEGIPCWEVDAGSEQLVVTPLGSLFFINKRYSSFPPCSCVIDACYICMVNLHLILVLEIILRGGGESVLSDQ